MTHDSRKLSQILADTFNPERGASSYGKVVDELDSHGIAIILVLFSIPSALPIPAAGYSTVLSIPLFLIGLRLLAAKDTVWLPTKVRERDFEPKSFQKLLVPMNKMVSLLERFTRPRLVAVAESKIILVLVGLVICLLACSMALPIPGTNTAPAFGIFLLGFGLLEKDGLLILLGIIASFVAMCVSIFVIKFGYNAVKAAIAGFL